MSRSFAHKGLQELFESGKSRKVRLRVTKAGRTLIARGKAVKIVLDVSLSRGSRTATQRFTTTLKAQRRAKRR